jgi:hypothetical protein
MFHVRELKLLAVLWQVHNKNWTIHKNRPDIVLLDKTMKETLLTDLAMSNSHNLHNTITKKLQNYMTWNRNLLECDKWK